MLRPNVPLYEKVYTKNRKTYLIFRGCNLSCGDCYKKFTQGTIYYYKFNELIDEIVSQKTKTVVFTGGEPALYEPLIADIQEEIDRRTDYKDFFNRNWEIVTNGARPLFNYYDKVTIRYKLNGGKIYDVKALSDKYEYVFTIEKVENLIIFEQIMLTHRLKNITLQSKNPEIKLIEYCKLNGFTYKKYTDVC